MRFRRKTKMEEDIMQMATRERQAESILHARERCLAAFRERDVRWAAVGPLLDAIRALDSALETLARAGLTERTRQRIRERPTPVVDDLVEAS
jgi:hypothetical protein